MVDEYLENEDSPRMKLEDFIYMHIGVSGSNRTSQPMDTTHLASSPKTDLLC
jgi:hypothetical protein